MNFLHPLATHSTGRRSLLLAMTWVWIAGLFAGDICLSQDVSFNRDVRPILAAKCFFCHGPDENHREAGLRLDRREDAIDYGAIVAADPGNSLMVERIESTDEDVMMPPPSSKKSLTDQEKQTLGRWIQQGAKYDQHWAFAPPTAAPVPEPTTLTEKVDLHRWPRNEIDAFVLKRMIEKDLQPSPQADRYTLVRRLYLDLIGLPPTIEQAEAFVQSDDPQAWEKLVDELLESPHYGEHWARSWLDLARYSDTNGYEKDRPRSIWPYRDWVIRALNRDLPYDQFTIQQLAGDMLPNATLEQKIATGFHRNTMLNEEGGIDPLEYRYLAMIDRVATTGTVWMGLTVGCAQCHTHKFDPISHTDFYAMMALLNNADEPDLTVPDSAITQRRQQLQQKIDQAIADLAKQYPVEGDVAEADQEAARDNQLAQATEDWINQAKQRVSRWRFPNATKLESNLPRLQQESDQAIFSSGDITKRDVFELEFQLQTDDLPVRAIRIEALPDARLPADGPGRTFYEGRKGDFFLSELSASLDEQTLAFADASSSYQPPGGNARQVYDGNGSSGWQPGARKGERLQLVVNLKQAITQPGTLRLEMLFERHYAVSLGRFRVGITGNPDAQANAFPAEVELLLADKPGDWTAEQKRKLQREFLLSTEKLKAEQEKIAQLQKQLPEQPHTLVMQERPADHPRSTYRHHRGEYLSPREEVEPQLISLFRDQTAPDQRPTNRLELARWLVSPANPLAARVAVNRAWRSFFGTGLVETAGDYGVQSTPPSHPELLDWLAVTFSQDDQWSLKQLHRRIVTSATYRQSGDASPEQIATDPDNRWLARGPRFRMTGEMIRDASLLASGKLSDKMFGPGVRPPQPDSVTALAYGNPKWNASPGEDRFRRSIYTFSKRTASFAAYSLFDAPSGEVCLARRNRSNTPTQALTTLNDPMFVELAQALATRAIQSTDPTDGKLDPIEFIFRSVLTRPPTTVEQQAMERFVQQQADRLASSADNPELNAWAIAGLDVPESGDGDTQPTADMCRQAALTMLARAVMNLDEAINKP